MPYYTCDTFDLATEEIKSVISNAYKNVSEHNTESGKTEEPAVSIIDQIENFLSAKYNFRYNIVTKRLEYKLLQENNYKSSNDYTKNSMVRELLKANIKYNISKLRNIIGSIVFKI